MRREQAVRINDHLLDALEALEKAEMAIADLAQQERLRFDDLLDEILLDLHEKLLVPIYEQHPDLEPPEADENPFRLGSDLVWDEVRLPPSVTEDRLDEIIFQLLKPRWQKTAMLVIRAIERCRELGLPIDDEVIAARLTLLSDSDRIEGIGDLRIWIHSEVRLKD